MCSQRRNRLVALVAERSTAFLHSKIASIDTDPPLSPTQRLKMLQAVRPMKLVNRRSSAVHLTSPLFQMALYSPIYPFRQHGNHDPQNRVKDAPSRQPATLAHLSTSSVHPRQERQDRGV